MTGDRGITGINNKWQVRAVSPYSASKPFPEHRKIALAKQTPTKELRLTCRGPVGELSDQLGLDAEGFVVPAPETTARTGHKISARGLSRIVLPSLGYGSETDSDSENSGSEADSQVSKNDKEDIQSDHIDVCEGSSLLLKAILQTNLPQEARASLARVLANNEFLCGKINSSQFVAAETKGIVATSPDLLPDMASSWPPVPPRLMFADKLKLTIDFAEGIWGKSSSRY